MGGGCGGGWGVYYNSWSGVSPTTHHNGHRAMYFARCCMLDLRPLEWRVALVSHMTSGEVSVTDMFQHHRLEEANFLLYDTVHPQCSAVEYQSLSAGGVRITGARGMLGKIICGNRSAARQR